MIFGRLKWTYVITIDKRISDRYPTRSWSVLERRVYLYRIDLVSWFLIDNGRANSGRLRDIWMLLISLCGGRA